MTWRPIVGQPFTPAAFITYAAGLTFGTWRPSILVLHNTQIPTLAKWHQVGGRKYMAALERFYRDTQKWSAGPHLFIDDAHIWVFTPLTMPGVHSPSWNRVSFGVEMVGDYEHEAPPMALWQNTASAIATLCTLMKMDPDVRIRLHKEDPATTHDCPGKMVSKARMIALVKEKIAARAKDCPPNGIMPGVPS